MQSNLYSLGKGLLFSTFFGSMYDSLMEVIDTYMKSSYNSTMLNSVTNCFEKIMSSFMFNNNNTYKYCPYSNFENVDNFVQCPYANKSTDLNTKHVYPAKDCPVVGKCPYLKNDSFDLKECPFKSCPALYQTKCPVLPETETEVDVDVDEICKTQTCYMNEKPNTNFNECEYKKSIMEHMPQLFDINFDSYKF